MKAGVKTVVNKEPSLVGSIKENLRAFEGAVVDTTTISHIETMLQSLLYQAIKYKSERKYIKFKIKKAKEKGHVTIPAGNLFTLLLLCGIRVPYNTVKNKKSYKMSNGTVIGLNKDGGACVIPVFPLEYIECEFKINNK